MKEERETPCMSNIHSNCLCIKLYYIFSFFLQKAFIIQISLKNLMFAAPKICELNIRIRLKLAIKKSNITE